MPQIGRSLVRSPAGVNGFFIDTKSFRSRYGPEVDSASNRNEYQGYFLGVKSGRYVRLTTLPPSCAVVMKSGNLNFLEHSGPVQACNGTVLPLPFRCYLWLYYAYVRLSCYILRSGHTSILPALNLQPAATPEPDDLCGNQRYRRELLMMGIIVLETCWA